MSRTEVPGQACTPAALIDMHNDLSGPLGDTLLRIGLALLSGLILGLNRWLHHKPAGIRTHSLVAVASAAAMLLIDSHVGTDAQAHSRVLQGLLTGIGFLGAGVIIRETNSRHIHGLTTAASLWASALVGAAFGAGHLLLGTVTLGATMLVLLLGGRLENLIGRWFNRSPTPDHNDSNQET